MCTGPKVAMCQSQWGVGKPRGERQEVRVALVKVTQASVCGWLAWDWREHLTLGTPFLLFPATQARNSSQLLPFLPVNPASEVLCHLVSMP